MYLGIDLGTSNIKLVLLSSSGKLIDSVSSPLNVERPHPLWSEQHPNDWWHTFDAAMQSLIQRNDAARIEAIGLTGQMHGAVLLDTHGDVIRPAILWNDGRSSEQCKQLKDQVADSEVITGNLIMPGFTAPKLLWLQQNEPEAFARIHKVLLPKDYLRWCLTNDYATDVSDAAGTLWLDVARRDWSDTMLTACGLDRSHMPRLYEGTQITGIIKPALAKRWGMQCVAVVAGGSDNAAGAVGVGVVGQQRGMLSLGTSGVYFVSAQRYSQGCEDAVHSFCHALPNQWHLMSVMLSAASCLQWFADQVAKQPLDRLMQSVESECTIAEDIPYFLPYLSGERTPHNDPLVQGSFIGLTHSTTQQQMLVAVLEGVSFAFADAVEVLHNTGTVAQNITLIGGGTRSDFWRQMLADVLNLPLDYREDGEVGPALGAAKLAQIAIETHRTVSQICTQPRLIKRYHPTPAKHAVLAQRRHKFVALYSALSGHYHS
ncbi:xylulokinase [Alteromonas oceanisediminis]|uniref:xylulokinase n=1 Tax=Alteromonas oceanisediminis TaxID=2836180 RepID=UPI001BDAEEB2|nr:xylulokinase [Alteromonas oceanisediminis]